MDTLSRDSSSSSNSIVPMIGAVAGVLAIILAIVALVKLSTLQKTVAAQGEEVAKISSIEAEVRAAATKSDLKSLSDGVQNALNQVGEQIGTIKAQVTKLEEAAKKAPVAAKGGKGGAGGTVDANGNYTVAAKDTIRKIAAKFGTTPDAIEAENPGLDPTKLRVGQKIKIPKK
ncbi:MAG: LysM peptidoglycan-binding domain-containing protein [Opitutales bacterium]